MNIGKKFTLVKPKFKKLIPDIKSKEFLFLSYKTFFQNLKTLEIRSSLMLFQLKYITPRTFS